MNRSDNPFKITATPEPEAAHGQPVAESNPSADPIDRVRTMVRSSEIFMLIKGTPQQPMCGFSANTVALMESLGVPYRTFDVLSDESIRAAAKGFANVLPFGLGNDPQRVIEQGTRQPEYRQRGDAHQEG